MAISDIHFDPFVTEGLADDLLAGTALEDLARKPAAGTFPNYGSDTNLPLLRASLDALTAVAADAEFVVFPGDTLSHDFNARAAAALKVAEDDPRVGELAARTTAFVVDSVRAAAGDVPVLFALGNEDAACGDYMLAPGGNYLRRIEASVRSAAGSNNLAADFADTWRAGGYYEARHPAVAGGRILVLNSVLWSAKYRDRCGDGGRTAGVRQRRWLEQRLAAAQDAGDTVWIVMHIPPGIDAFSSRHAETTCRAGPVVFLDPNDQADLLRLLARYLPVITAIVAGHTHHNAYRIVSAASTPEPGAEPQPTGKGPATARGGTARAVAGVIKIVPSISPIFGNNPGLQRFETSGDGRLGDVTTYSIDLAAPAAPVRAVPWRQTYRFEAAYGATFSATTVRRVADAVIERPASATARTFAERYPLGHQPPTGDLLRSVGCSISHLEPETFRACFCP